MGFFDILAEVIAAPVTITAKTIDLSIKAVESAPDLVEKVIEKVEDSFDNIGK